MRNLFKKLGSLALGVGALTLVLSNAALTHGCARSPTAQAPQAGTASEASESSGSDNPAVSEKAAANPNCTPPSYMYATKAPIWVPPECYGGTPAATPPPQQLPSQGANAQQQAP